MQTENNCHDIRTSIFNATSRTFEDMTFSKVEGLKFYWGCVTIKSPCNGKLSISMPDHFIKEISQNMYSLEDTKVNEKVMLDVIAELANTIAGQFMGLHLGEGQICELGLPETGISDSVVYDEGMKLYPFKVDNGFVLIGTIIK